MSYEFQTSIGTFWIRANPCNADAVILGIDHVTIGFYNSPAAAAEAVYAKETGWELWDTLQEINNPSELGHWVKLNP